MRIKFSLVSELKLLPELVRSCSSYLDAPVQRVGSVFTPVGFHPILEKAILPTEDKIYDAARTLLEY